VSIGVVLWRVSKYRKFKLQITDVIRQELHRAKQNWELFSKNWNNRVNGESFISTKRAIYKLKQEYDSLSGKREHLLKNMLNYYFQQQLAQHLDQYRIESANLDGIGPGRIATLQSYGIETAEDINLSKLSTINGFGEKLVMRLLDWRRQCEGLFSFDPASMPTQSIIASIDRDIASKRQKIKQDLSAGMAQLTAIRVQVEKDRQSAVNEALTIFRAYEQAAVNAKEVWVHT
jgi:DNA-binding helix-hairpin-helix protein with protein kinase domain